MSDNTMNETEKQNVLTALLKRSGDTDLGVALAAQRQLAKAIELPLRQGIMYGDVVGGIFERMPIWQTFT